MKRAGEALSESVVLTKERRFGQATGRITIKEGVTETDIYVHTVWAKPSEIADLIHNLHQAVDWVETLKP